VDLGGNPDVVGTFRLDQNSELSFRWHKGNEGFEIINCLLEMEAGNPDGKREKEKCKLREVSRVKPIQFDLSKAEVIEQLVSRNQLTNTLALEMECEFKNLPGEVPPKGPTVLRVGDSVKFDIKKVQNGNIPRTAVISVKLVEAELDVRIEIEMQLELRNWNSETNEFNILSLDYTPQLMGKISGQLDEMKSQVETKRTALATSEKLVVQVRKDAQRNLDEKGKILAAYQKKIDSHDADVGQLAQRHSLWNAAYTQLKQQADDMNQLLDEISKNGQLQFSLRLMIPDAGANGIELVTTDDGVAVE